MSKKDYLWKRFWCPRSGSINLTDGGYLYDPDSEWGRAYNPDLVSLEAIADVPCLVLLGEPGSGKSQELENLKALTESKICGSSQILDLNLRSCVNLKEDLFKDEAFTNWLEDSYHLYLFLDSLDEGLLSIPTLAAGLVDELKKAKYQNQINRLHLRLACRTFVFPEILEEGLEDLWQKANFAIYELASLRRIDVIQAAKAEDLSSDNFLQEIDQKGIVPLAVKPITLKFLLNTYRRHNDQFPPEQKLHELYLEGCKLLCEEVNESRHASDRTGNFDSDQRLIVAARIAAVTIFANRFAVWTGVDQGHIPAEDVFWQRLCFGCEKVNRREFEITKEVVKEVLDTGLFSSRGLHRMGWAHQTYAEFLAAWYLTQHEIALEKATKLIFSSEVPDNKLIPQLHETSAWLASMRDDVFHEIIETDPDVLLQSDLTSIDQVAKVSLIDSLLKLYDSGRLSYQYDNFRAFKYLKYPAILEQLKPYICDSKKNIQARYVAIDIAESCDLTDASSILVEVALASGQPYSIRSRAANFVANVGSEEDKLKLKVLYIAPQDDPEDNLRGYGLQATYPKHITTEEVLSHLTQTQVSYFGGCYQDFLASEFGKRIPNSDLFIALEWVKKQPVKHESHYPFDALADSIMLRAWNHLDDSTILSSFAEIIVLKQSQYVQVIDDYGSISFKEMLQKDEVKRHALIEEVVSIIQDSDKEPFWLSGNSDYSSLVPLKQDFIWLIEKLKSSTSEQIQRIYAKLIYWEFDRKNTEQISLIITASQGNSILKDEFESDLETIFLNSKKASELKSKYLKRQQNLAQRDKKQLDPPPRIRISQCLDRFESGQVDAWWHLCQEMTLLPTSTHYNQSWKVDITTMPGWQEADETVRRRIIEAAKQYICKGNPNTDAWLGTSSFPQYILSGYQALRLISVKELEFISTLSSEIWTKWTAIILDYPNARGDRSVEIRENLLKRVYQNDSNEFFRVLGILIDRENSQYGRVQIHKEAMCCWDTHLKYFLLSKAREEVMTARSLGDLLEVLLAHQVEEAKDFAESLITFPLPEDKKEREKISVAAQNLILYSPNSAWESISKIFQSAPNFSKEILEGISSPLEYKGDLENQLKEEYMADLYIFIMKYFPDANPENQSDSREEQLTGVRAYSIGPAERIRMWRDRIPQRLQQLATREACQALQKIIDELPDLKENLQWRLAQAEALARRKAWKLLEPEEFLQFVISQEPSNSDVINQITQKMEEEPKIENNIIISNSPNSPINAPIGTSGVTNSNVTIASSDAKKGISWGNWLAVTGILVAVVAIPLSMSVSGAFNEEFKEWFNRIFPANVEQQPALSDE